MSRPGPKPALDSPTISEHLLVHEQLLRHLVNSLGASSTTSEGSCLSTLLHKLDELNARRQGHCCSVCAKAYSDAKGLRRHVLGAADSYHRELADALMALCCARCGRRFSRREQVTKHEANCGRAAGGVLAGTKRPWTEMEEGEGEGGEEEGRAGTTIAVAPIAPIAPIAPVPAATTATLQLPRIMMFAPPSPYAAYFTRADLM
ncbi:uncharacterized protein LAJ45_01382 [Morchella importuna]|uniref:uncharacterized protein n=1 Tax=Morchella importuna TaxID=1174673 RepID=UPI001E8E0F0D|nr:uncharacterized protein LAJ45_01382 [Morchella importuna]KAH8154851.1 hypothetical protein LAJ45_01382 [Morchella importuna]